VSKSMTSEAEVYLSVAASIVVHVLVITTIELVPINDLVFPQVPPSASALLGLGGRRTVAPITRIVTPHRSFPGTLPMSMRVAFVFCLYE
jgi:hypothetical protein